MPAAPGRYLIKVASRLPAAVVCRRYLIVVPRALPSAPLAVHCTYLIVFLGGTDACISRQAHVLAVVASPAPVAQNASGVLSGFSCLDRILPVSFEEIHEIMARIKILPRISVTGISMVKILPRISVTGILIVSCVSFV